MLVKMANDEEAEMLEIPPSVAHLVAVNTEFAVLICAKASCRRAQAVGGIEEHLRKFHHEKPTSYAGRLLHRESVEHEPDTGPCTPVNPVPPAILPTHGLTP